MLQEKELTLEKVQNIARALETAELQTKVIESKGTNNMSSESSQIAKLSVRPKNKRNFGRGKSKAENSSGEENTGLTCYKCGSANFTIKHLSKCPANGQSCNKCGRKGHFMSMCKLSKGTRKVNSA